MRNEMPSPTNPARMGTISAIGRARCLAWVLILMISSWVAFG